MDDQVKPTAHDEAKGIAHDQVKPVVHDEVKIDTHEEQRAAGPFLEVRGLFSAGGAGGHGAFRNVSFTAECGETLLLGVDAKCEYILHEALTLREDLSGGEIRFGGRRVTSQSDERWRVRHVPSGKFYRQVYADAVVGEKVAFEAGLRQSFLGDVPGAPDARKCLEQMNVAGLEGARYGDLEPMDRVCAMIAERVLARDASVILLEGTFEELRATEALTAFLRLRSSLEARRRERGLGWCVLLLEKAGREHPASVLMADRRFRITPDGAVEL